MVKFKCLRCGAVYEAKGFYKPCPECGADWTQTKRLLFLEP